MDACAKEASSIMSRSCALASAAIVVWLLTASFVRAECVIITAKQVMTENAYEVVFSGAVVEIVRTSDDGYRATFDVDRVWKGSISKRLDLYVWEIPSETPRFDVGFQYLALAQRLIAPRARRDVGLGDTDTLAYTPLLCSDRMLQAPDIIRDLGPGRPPM
jgi:hypothetical protein